MGSVTTFPQSRPLTVADLDLMPDDGHRYELIDGTLIVTPAPVPRHQVMVGELHILLRQSCPHSLRVLLAPLDVVLAEDTVVQPDLLVTRRTDLTERNLPTAPLLAVEVASPSTRLLDLNLKRARYEQAGCPAYWVVDPDDVSLTAWELHDGQYVEVARVRGDEVFESRRPYPLRVVPADLLDD
jgi:Uma2 family endonuclease